MLNKLETQLFKKLLDEFANTLGNNSCNDFALPNTPENKQFLKDIYSSEQYKAEHDYWEQVLADVEKSTSKTIYTLDIIVLAYLRNKIGL